MTRSDPYRAGMMRVGRALPGEPVPGAAAPRPCRRRLAAVCCAAALSGCGGPRVAAPAGDAVLRNHLGDGAAAYARGNAARAGEAYHDALRRAEVSDNPDGIRAAARNLAVLAMDAGRWERARTLLDEAAANAPAAADAAEIEVLQARADIGRGDSARARERLAEVAASPDEIPGTVRDQARLLQAELALTENRPEDARRLVTVLDGSRSSLEPRRRRLLAALSEYDEAWADAAVARNQEADAWQDAGDWRSMALARERAGDDLARAGRGGEAVGAWMRAARSLAAQGDAERATRVLDRCVETGEMDPALARRIERLRESMSAAP